MVYTLSQNSSLASTIKDGISSESGIIGSNSSVIRVDDNSAWLCYSGIGNKLK